MPARKRRAASLPAVPLRSIELVSDRIAARELAEVLLDENRTDPAVVVTTPAGRQQPWFDLQVLTDELADTARIFHVVNASVAYALSDSLPPRTQVYGGAARTYPPGREWLRNPRQSPLRLAHGPEDAPTATADVVADALAATRAPEPSASALEPSPAPPAGNDEVARLTALVDDLRSALAVTHERYVRAVNAREADRAELSKVRQAARAVRKGGDSPAAPDWSGLFLDPEEQFRFEVHVAWACRIAASDKADLPLPQYVVGPDFLASLNRLEGVTRAKVVDVTVEVLTGLDRTNPARASHPLRSSEGGGTPPRTRADGAVAWRAAIQRSTPSARRLHYWRGPDGTIELARVVTHDDMSI